MQPTQAQISHLEVSGISKAALAAVPQHAPGVAPFAGVLTWRAASMRKPTVEPAPLRSPRCAERGCVFPAAPGPDGKCLHHLRQTREPILFSSYQPTRAVLDRGRFGVPGEEVDTSRNRDRRQLVAMREAFLED